MPRTASTSQTRKSIHSRLRPQPAPSERDKTPVLLRLPRIEIAEDASAFEEDASLAEAAEAEALNYAIPEEIADSPEYGDLPGIPKHEIPTQESEREDTREEMDSLDSTVESVDTRVADLDTQTIVATAPEHSVVTTQVDAMAHVQTDGEQSWWEHWSSGVVLIILIIALVTASILAFNDTPGGDPNLLAEKPNPNTDVTSSNLDDISIPDLVESSSREAVSGQEAIALPGLGATSPHLVEPNESSGAPTIDAQLVGSSSPSSTDGPTLADPSSSSFESESLLLGSADDLQFTNVPQTSETAEGSRDESTADEGKGSPESSLELTPPPLAAPSMNKTATGLQLSPMGGDLSTPVAEPPAMLFSEKLANDAVSDHNSMAPPLPTLPTIQVSTGDAAPDFNQASHVVPKPTAREASEQSTGSAPGTTTQVQGATTPPSTATSDSPSATLTPDSDAKAIMRAYREFQQIASPSNRYPSSN